MTKFLDAHIDFVTNLPYFCDKNNFMNSVASKIKEQILLLEKGSIFFPDDFINLGTSDAIRQTLTRLCKDGLIIRIAQGIYSYPIIEEKLGLGVIIPTYDQIALALAERDHARIAPTGIYAQNILGLSTQVPMNYVYLTDGSKRHVEISNGRGITFKNTAPKNLAFKNKLAMLITFALKSLKEDNIEEWQIKHIYELLKNEPKDSIMSDFKLMPIWIRNIITKAYE